MCRNPPSRRQFFDFIENLEKGIDGSGEENLGSMEGDVLANEPCDGREENALVDSVSQVTCISEQLYRSSLAVASVQELPVSNLCVVTAIGSKAITVRRQVLLRLCIGGQTIEYIFFVVPHLVTSMILGHDWLMQNRVTLQIF